MKEKKKTVMLHGLLSKQLLRETYWKAEHTNQKKIYNTQAYFAKYACVWFIRKRKNILNQLSVQCCIDPFKASSKMWVFREQPHSFEQSI